MEVFVEIVGVYGGVGMVGIIGGWGIECEVWVGLWRVGRSYFVVGVRLGMKLRWWI